MDVNHYGKRKTVQKIFFHLRKKWGKYFFYNGYWYKLNTKYKFYEYKKIPTNLHIHAPIDPGLLENQTFMEKLKKIIRKDPKKSVKTIYDDVCAKNACAVPQFHEIQLQSHTPCRFINYLPFMTCRSIGTFLWYGRFMMEQAGNGPSRRHVLGSIGLENHFFYNWRQQ